MCILKKKNFFLFHVSTSSTKEGEEQEAESTSETTATENSQETENTNPEPRSIGKKFKEKKVTSLAANQKEGEIIGFKKTKFGSTRNVRKRFDDN